LEWNAASSRKLDTSCGVPFPAEKAGKIGQTEPSDHRRTGKEIKRAAALSSSQIEELFSSLKILQNFSDSPSHRIFEHMHESLNIDKK
jgi:hypothetical protein